MKKKMTKIDMVLQYMLNNDGITQLDAYRLCYATRLSAIIFELKRRGYHITTEMCVYNGSRYAKYRIGGDE